VLHAYIEKETFAYFRLTTRDSQAAIHPCGHSLTEKTPQMHRKFDVIVNLQDDRCTNYFHDISRRGAQWATKSTI